MTIFKRVLILSICGVSVWPFSAAFAERFSASFELVSPAGLSYASIISGGFSENSCASTSASQSNIGACATRDLSITGFDTYSVVIAMERRDGARVLVTDQALLDHVDLRDLQSLSVILQ